MEFLFRTMKYTERVAFFHSEIDEIATCILRNTGVEQELSADDYNVLKEKLKGALFCFCDDFYHKIPRPRTSDEDAFNEGKDMVGLCQRSFHFDRVMLQDVTTVSAMLISLIQNSVMKKKLRNQTNVLAQIFLYLEMIEVYKEIELELK